MFGSFVSERFVSLVDEHELGLSLRVVSIPVGVPLA